MVFQLTLIRMIMMMTNSSQQDKVKMAHQHTKLLIKEWMKEMKHPSKQYL
jgi:hypothetical protein